MSKFLEISEDDNTMHTSNNSDVDMKMHPPPPLNEQELDAAGVYFITSLLIIKNLLIFYIF